MISRRALLQGLALAGLGASNTSVRAGQATPDWQTVVASNPGRITMLGLFGNLAPGDIPPGIDAFVSRGFRTAGKGLALYVSEPNGRELTIAGQRLFDEAIVVAPGHRTEILASLRALERHWRIQAQDGRWFTLASQHESDMFGTLGDGSIEDRPDGTARIGGTPCTAECQAYLDYCTYFAREPARWSAGIHLVDDVLHAGYGDTFHQTTMGGASAWYMAEAGFGGTAFVSPHTDRPVFNLAGQRDATLRDFSVIGVFRARRRAAGLGSVEAWRGPNPLSNGRHDIDSEAWDLPGGRRTDDRYCPSAGIAVDAYAGARPSVSYPPPVYPVWLPALRPWSGAVLSSSIKMRDLSIAGFAVGLAVGTSTDPRQGDFVQFHSGMISDCKWAVSVGNHQSRNVAIRDSRISNCWTALTNVAHGARAGRFGGVIENVAFGEVINLFDFNPDAGPCCFVACYGEALWRLGWYTGGNGFTPAIGFDHCQFSFDAVNPARGVASTLR